MIVPGPLEHACWRRFAAQWGDCKKSPIAPLNMNMIIIIIIIIIIITIINASVVQYPHDILSSASVSYLLLSMQTSTASKSMPRSQRDDYHLLSWKQQVVLVRLRTGHNRLNSHMHRKLKLAPSPTCPCGQEEQTTEHVLQRCTLPLHKTTREDVWPVSTPLTTRLYGGKQELEKTMSFISRVALIV